MCAYNSLPPHTSFHIILSFQILLSSQFLPFLMPFQGLQVGSRAGPGPRCGGLIEVQAGGTLRGRPPGLSHAPARTLPISEEPLRGAGGWENSLLAVTDVDEES